MPDSRFLPITELLPHRGPAVLLERVLAHDATTTVCSVDTARSVLYRDDEGRVPTYVGLEYMAQAVAAHGGLLDREAGRDARPGFFLGSRRLAFAAERFESGQQLVVTATHLRGATGLLAFDCSIRAAGEGVPHHTGDAGLAPDGEVMVSGVLTVYLLESFEALTRDFATDD